MNKKSIVTSLPRGGYIVDTPAGLFQFGAPPETVKDTMTEPHGVPQVFILPNRFFNWIKGISVAEVEFPIYYNFFLKKRKTYIVCTKEQLHRFSRVLREAIFGPRHIDLEKDFNGNIPKEEYPTLKGELKYFRNNLKLTDLVNFIIFKDKKVTLQDVTIQAENEHEYHLYYNKKLFAKVPSTIEYNPTYDIGKRLQEPFDPPLFGVTCLGPSHGFDPTENTSGFILWINRRGIMVDPPVNSNEWLIDSNVSPKLIDSIILTHCHADHDAGTLQKILEEVKVTVYTTPTIIDSFFRKYCAFTAVSHHYFSQLFDFKQVTIGEPIHIHGAKFNFFYSLHSIPTIGFRLEVGGKTLVYSSDHNNDPSLHKKLLDEGFISESRYNELRSFPWDADIIYHEAGIPPLHTPINYLDSLDDAIKKKSIVYHIAKKDFPEKTLLRLAQFGVEKTVRIPIQAPKFDSVYHILGILSYLDFFEDMPISKAQEFLHIVNEEKYHQGSKIIKKGDIGDKFYIIRSGNVSVLGDDLEQRKIYGVYDYFGEAALLNDKPRSADVVAATDVVLYSIDKEGFLSFINGTELKRTFKRLAQIRDSETWNVLSTSPFFRILSSTQKTYLESILHKQESVEPRDIIKKGNRIDRIYIIRDGEVEVTDGKEDIARLQRGDFLGAMIKVYRDEPAEYTYKNSSPVSLYYIERNDIRSFLDNNPGLMMKLVYSFSHYENP